MHGPGEARYRPERRGEVEVGGCEVARRRDLTQRAPINAAAAADRAVDERDHALRKPRDLVRLEIGPKRQARYVEGGVPRLGREAVFDADVGDQRSFVPKSARGAHIIAADREMEIVGTQR